MNSGGEEKRRRARRHLTREEHALWKSVTQSVAPLRPQATPEPQGEDVPAEVSRPASPPDNSRPPKSRDATPKPSAPRLAPLGRRLRQQVARGSAAIDSRIDLHGMTQDRAHTALKRFLRRAQAENAKLVLVITGKGARTSDHELHRERGVLKRLVPHWLELPEFRPYVIGFEPAHVTHGGEGALYVRVRRGPS